MQNTLTFMACCCILVLTSSGKADDPVVGDSVSDASLQTKLDGAWRKVAYKQDGKGGYIKAARGEESTERVKGGRYQDKAVREDGEVIWTGNGTLVVIDEAKFVMKVETVSAESMEWIKWKPVVFRYVLVGDFLYREGVVYSENGGKLNVSEIWERTK